MLSFRPCDRSFDSVNVRAVPVVAKDLDDAYLFDLFSCPEMMDAGLADILKDDTKTKIMHSCREGCSMVFHEFGVSSFVFADVVDACPLADNSTRLGMMRLKTP